MAASPKYKVYDNDGQYVAACKEAEDAAVLVLIAYPDRGSVRLGHGKTLFTSGVDGNAQTSYDDAAKIILDRESGVHRSAHRAAYQGKETGQTWDLAEQALGEIFGTSASRRLLTALELELFVKDFVQMRQEDAPDMLWRDAAREYRRCLGGTDDKTVQAYVASLVAGYRRPGRA